MKNNIYISAAIVIAMLTLAVFGLFNLYSTEKQERKRVSENSIAVLTDRSKQQELTVREFKLFYPKLDSLAKKLDIKSKNITNIIETQYHFKDTTLIKTMLKQDSINERKLFSISSNCYRFSGFVNRDTIALTEKELTDKLTTILYKDWRHKYFFKLIKTKSFYRACVFSRCMNDTVSIENNIKIIDK